MSDILDLDQVAALFGVTEKAVRDWIDAGCPVKELGTRGGARKKTRLSLKAVVRWYFRENYERLELERQRSELARAQARRVVLENAKEEGTLVRADAITKDVATMIATAQALLLAIPSKEAPMLAPITNANAIEQRLAGAIRDALQQLSEYGAVSDQRSDDTGAGDRDDGGSIPPASAPNRKRVGRRVQAAQ